MQQIFTLAAVKSGMHVKKKNDEIKRYRKN